MSMWFCTFRLWVCVNFDLSVCLNMPKRRHQNFSVRWVFRVVAPKNLRQPLLRLRFERHLTVGKMPIKVFCGAFFQKSDLSRSPPINQNLNFYFPSTWAMASEAQFCAQRPQPMQSASLICAPFLSMVIAPRGQTNIHSLQKQHPCVTWYFFKRSTPFKNSIPVVFCHYIE